MFTTTSSFGRFLTREFGLFGRKSIHFTKWSIAVVVLSAGLAARDARSAPDADDDTLRFYLSKSKLVVVGEFVSEPLGLRTEVGVVGWTAEFRIDDVLKGDRPGTEKLTVGIVRFDFGSLLEKNDRDRPTEVKLGGKCILFLNERGSTADMWFGVQPSYPSMIRSLRRLASEASVQAK